MTRTVIALYDKIDDANHAVRELIDNGFDRSSISLMAGDRAGTYSTALGNTPTEAQADTSGASQGAGIGASIGAVLGGIGGLLVGLGALVIPGIGPVIAAGPLAAALAGLAGAGAGAVAGGVTGGLIGALVDVGVPEETAQYYSEGVRRGGTLLTVRTDDNMSGRAVNIMNRHNPVDINSRASQWREQGWTGFNANEDVNDVTHDQESTGTVRGVVDKGPETEERYGAQQNIPNTGDQDMTYGNAGSSGYGAGAGMGGVNSQFGQSGSDYRTSDAGPSGQNYAQGGSRGTESGVTGGREGETHHDYEESRKRTDWGPEETRGQMHETGQDVGTGTSPYSRGEKDQEDYSTGGVSSQNLRTDDVRGQDVTNEGMIGRDVNMTAGGDMSTGTDYDSTRMGDRGTMGSDYQANRPAREFGYYDSDFRTHFGQSYGTSYSYDQYQPAYRYGYDLASDPRYANRNWQDVEPEARRYWDERQPGAWDRIKGAVEHAWNEVKKAAS